MEQYSNIDWFFAQHLGNLTNTEFFYIMKDNNFLILLLETAKMFFNLRIILFYFERFEQIFITFDLLKLLFFKGNCLFFGSVSININHGIAGNTIEQTTQTLNLLLGAPNQIVPGTQKDIIGSILSLFFVSNFEVNKAINSVNIGIVEDTKGFCVLFGDNFIEQPLLSEWLFHNRRRKK